MLIFLFTPKEIELRFNFASSFKGFLQKVIKFRITTIRKDRQLGKIFITQNVTYFQQN